MKNEKAPTFSQRAKEEILNGVKSLKPCCQTAFLSAVLGGGGAFSLTSDGLMPLVTTKDIKLLEVCADIARRRFAVETEIYKEQKGKSEKFVGKFSAGLCSLLHLTDNEKGFLSVSFPNNIVGCCKLAFARGLFAAFGSVTVPKHSEDLYDASPSQSYHLEISLAQDEWIAQTESILLDVESTFKQVERKEATVFYLKDSEHIGNFLVSIGGLSAKLQLENILVERSVRNNANRQANCISANIDKAVAASEKQIVAIERLKRSGILNGLSVDLRETAEVRLTNPEATLAELAAKLNVTKNCINKRLTKLQELAQ